MSERDKEALTVLFHGLALGFGFIWLGGFAIGYPHGSWVVGWILPALAVASLVASSKVRRK